MTEGNTMKKLFAIMMCSALMLGVAGANGADGMSKDAMKKDGMSQMSHDGMAKDGM
jgi:pentapeptide MXKDX repeat protein